MRRPECIELLPDRRARPPRPGAGGRVSGPRRRAMGYRRGADLGPRRGRGGPPPSGVTTEWPAVRVDARGGEGRRTGVPIRSLCLTQRRELRGRVHGRAHQLAERALLRAACGRRGEHVFGRLRLGSDGTPTLRGPVCGSARIWLWIAQSDRRFLQAILHPVPGYAGRNGPPEDRLAARADAKRCWRCWSRTDSVINVILVEGAARKPDGDVIMADVAREDASVVLSDLKQLKRPRGRLDRAGADRHRAVHATPTGPRNTRPVRRRTRWCGRRSSSARARTSSSPPSSCCS